MSPSPSPSLRKHNKKPSNIPSWRNHLSNNKHKNASPARLSYVVAEPLECQRQGKRLEEGGDNDDNKGQRLESRRQSLLGRAAASSSASVAQSKLESLSLLDSGRVGATTAGATPTPTPTPTAGATRTATTTRAAQPPALVSMIVRAPERKPVTLLESPVSVNGFLNIPTTSAAAKGKEEKKKKKRDDDDDDSSAYRLEDLNMDSCSAAVASCSNTVRCEKEEEDITPLPSLNCIPPTTPASATRVDCSAEKHEATTCSNPTPLPNPSLVSSHPTIDADSSGPTSSSNQSTPLTQSDHPMNTLPEASSSPPPAPPPKLTPTELSTSSKKERSSWFTASWLGWPSAAPNNSIANTPLGGGSGDDSRVIDEGHLTNEQRAKETGNTRDGDDFEGRDNINPLEKNVRKGSREDDVEASQASHSLIAADNGADKASMSITRGNRNGKTSNIHGDPLAGSTIVERGNSNASTPRAVLPITQTCSHVDNQHPGSTVNMSSTPPDATCTSAPPSASVSGLVPSASGLNTNAGPPTPVASSQAASSTWWNYIGWKNAVAVPTDVPDPSTPIIGPAASTSPAIPVPSPSTGGTTAIAHLDPGSVESENAVNKDVPSQGESSLGSEPKIPKPVLVSVPSDDGGAPQGDKEREQAEQQQSQQEEVKVQEQGKPEKHSHSRNAAASSWYNPWSWHGSSSHPAVTDMRGAGEACAKEEGEEGETIEKQSVEPREETQGLQAPQVLISPPEQEQTQSPTADATVAASNSAEVEHNPISATIDSHRSSWLSFFASTSSRALVTKTIAAPPAPESASVGGGIPNNVKVDENGMEVVDIDDEAESPASQVSQAQSPSSDASKAKDKEGAKDQESKTTVSTAQGLVATLVRGRGRVRSTQVQVDADKDNSKEGISDASSIRSGVGGQGSGITTPANGMPIPSKSGAAEPSATGAGSLSSSPASTTVSLVKKASLSLTGGATKTSTATTANGNTTTSNGATTTTIGTTAAATATASGNDKNNKNKDKSKSVSPAPSPTSKKPALPPPLPNFVLPTWQETFHTAPRNIVPRRAEVGTLTKTVQYVSEWLFSGGRSGGSSLMGGSSGRRGREAGNNVDKGKRKASSAERDSGRKRELMDFGMVLPKAWDVLSSGTVKGEATNLKEDVLRGSRRVVVIGVHGWFPGAVMRTVIGEPTGTSTKLANMMAQALKEFENEHGTEFEKITKIPLEGEGTVKRRVEKLYSNLLGNKEWMDDLSAADAILVATHSQGSVVSTHLLDRLIADNHIRTAQNSIVTGPATSFPSAAGMETAPAPKVQRVCCLSMCGIHLGPLRYLSTSSLFQPYIQYLESPAARELFEFQNTNSEVSKEYVKALGRVLSNGVKMLYAASLNDQVVPIYSGLFTAASHPLILRALYIDGDAYNSSDFLANLLVLLLRILNSGIPDSGLLAHLSEATAGTLNGVGHSTPYEEIAIFSLAVKYLFLTNDGMEEHPELVLDPFNARQEQNDYEIPWALRDVIADERVTQYFSKEIVQLRDAFREWHPRSSILRDLKRKLQPIQRLPASFATSRL